MKAIEGIIYVWFHISKQLTNGLWRIKFLIFAFMVENNIWHYFHCDFIWKKGNWGGWCVENRGLGHFLRNCLLKVFTFLHDCITQWRASFAHGDISLENLNYKCKNRGFANFLIIWGMIVKYRDFCNFLRDLSLKIFDFA